MAVSLACAGFLVALILGVVGLRVQQVRLSYRLDALRTARTELEETRNRLRVEEATLKSLARIEGKARAELGMVLPGHDQIRLAREFVTVGTGLTSRAPLTAAADPSAPRGPTPGLR
jgi:cell division protein FtsL